MASSIPNINLNLKKSNQILYDTLLNEDKQSNYSFIETHIHNVLESDNNHHLKSIYSSYLDSLGKCKAYSPDKINKLNDLEDNKINIMNFNCRSLINKLDDIKSFIDSTNVQYDVVSSTETWLKPIN